VAKDSHARPGNPFGAELAHLFRSCPRAASDKDGFQILKWYLENGQVELDEKLDVEQSNKEILSTHDLLHGLHGIRIRSINTARGAAAEAIENLIWNTDNVPADLWALLEDRAEVENSLGVRCALMGAALALYNHDKLRCAKLAIRLSLPPGRVRISVGQKLLDSVARRVFGSDDESRLSVSSAKFISNTVTHFLRFQRRHSKSAPNQRWLMPLLTSRCSGTWRDTCRTPAQSC
jgi:hypothetical protein